jgi:nucleoside-diphosphate-sugar epimerase
MAALANWRKKRLSKVQRMTKLSIIVIGGTGLIGSAVCARLSLEGHKVISLNSKNYREHVGSQADVVVNCNGNSYRYKAAKDPRWDFDASVLSVEKSLFEFKCARYFYVSTIDVYDDVSDLSRTKEDSSIATERLHPYGFHKWLAERLVERFANDSLILRTGTVIGTGVKKGPLFDLAQNEPVHMSLDSELSLIDSTMIADALTSFIATPPPCRVVNLTGTGPARLRSLLEETGMSGRVAQGADQVVYRYQIDNTRLRQFFAMPTSHEMGVRFLKSKSNFTKSP